LVPLWQAYAQLTSSNTAAQAEIDAVVSQIQTTLTPAQVSAITALKLTRQDMVTEMSSLGLTNGGGANGTPGLAVLPARVAAVVRLRWRWRRWRRRSRSRWHDHPANPQSNPDRPAGAVCQPHHHLP